MAFGGYWWFNNGINFGANMQQTIDICKHLCVLSSSLRFNYIHTKIEITFYFIIILIHCPYRIFSSTSLAVHCNEYLCSRIVSSKYYVYGIMGHVTHCPTTHQRWLKVSSGDFYLWTIKKTFQLISTNINLYVIGKKTLHTWSLIPPGRPLRIQWEEKRNIQVYYSDIFVCQCIKYLFLCNVQENPSMSEHDNLTGCIAPRVLRFLQRGVTRLLWISPTFLLLFLNA